MGFPGPSVWLGLRRAASDLVGNFGAFAAANVVWFLIAGLTAAAASARSPAVVVGVLLVPATCGLMRMAGCAVRGMPVRLRHFREGARHRLWRQVLLGLVQLALLGIASLNIALGLSARGLLYASVAVLSGYVALTVWLLACATWPLLLEPEGKDRSWKAAVRLAFAVVAARPLSIAGLVLVETALVAIAVQTIVPAVLLPSFGALLAAHVVVPTADRLVIR